MHTNTVFVVHHTQCITDTHHIKSLHRSLSHYLSLSLSLSLTNIYLYIYSSPLNDVMCLYQFIPTNQPTNQLVSQVQQPSSSYVHPIHVASLFTSLSLSLSPFLILRYHHFHHHHLSLNNYPCQFAHSYCILVGVILLLLLL